MKFGKLDISTGEFCDEFSPKGDCHWTALTAMFSTAGTAAAVGSGAAVATGVSASGAALASSFGASAAGAAGGMFATTGAAAATAGAGSIFAGIGTLDVLSGGLSAFSALSRMAAGDAQSAALQTQANFETFGAKQEILKGRREALEIAEAAAEAIEQNIVAAGAAGLTGEGSVRAAQDAIREKANFETAITRSNAAINSGARRGTAESLRIDAGAARTSGKAAAAGEVAGFFINRARRG